MPFFLDNKIQSKKDNNSAMKHSTFWEANNHSGSQNYPPFMQPERLLSDWKQPTTSSYSGQMNPVHTLPGLLP